MFLNQRKYVLDLVNEAGLSGCKPSSTLMDSKQKLTLATAPFLTNHITYHRQIGQSIYLTVTRPDLAFCVHILSQFKASPTDEHLIAARRVLRYLNAVSSQCLLYSRFSSLTLIGYHDANWAFCPLIRRSISCMQFSFVLF